MLAELMIAVLVAVSADAAPIDLAITGGTCVDRSAGITIDCVVVIDAGKIVRSGPRRAIGVPPARRTIDARGRWIVPGFVDNHVHLGRVEADGDVWIRAGVTQLVENGSTVAPPEHAGQYPNGPAIAACGPIITSQGGYPALVAARAPALEVSGAKDARQAIEALIEGSRPRCLKIAVERGFQTELDDEGWPTLELDEVRAIVAEGHEHGLPVLAHVTQQSEFDRAVDGGVDVIAHAPIGTVSDESLRRAMKRDVLIVSTVALWGTAGLAPAAIDNLVRYVRMGGRIAIGSDYPNWKKPGLPIAELRALLDAGLSPKELLVALTRSAVATDPTEANLVILGSDPLLSIDALADVRAVLLDGRIVFESDPSRN